MKNVNVANVQLYYLCARFFDSQMVSLGYAMADWFLSGYALFASKFYFRVSFQLWKESDERLLAHSEKSYIV